MHRIFGINKPLFFVLIATVSLMPFSYTCADQPLVFVSAFAPGEKGSIHAFHLDEKSGELSFCKVTKEIEHPFFMALSPGNRFLYSIHAKSFGGSENEVVAFKVDGSDGNLKRLNSKPTRGKASCYIDVDRTGRCLLVSNYATGDVVSLPLRADGSLGDIKSYFKHEGSSVNPNRQKAPFAHCFVVGPNNQFAFAADLGIDKIMSYQLDPKSAELKPNNPPSVSVDAGGGPRHMTFHPNGKNAYVITELSNHIVTMDYDAKKGSLTKRQSVSTLPANFTGTTHTADVKVTPNGKFVYGTNRGHDSVACFRANPNGTLKLTEIVSSQGKGPQNLAITRSGRLLLCANMPGNQVVVFRIDEQTGRIKKVSSAEIPMPSCIMIAE